MKRILYASGSVLTGDDMAGSVARYATALARAGSADTIRVPVMKDHQLGTVDMLIGPSSQLIIEDAQIGIEEGFEDVPYLADIDDRCNRMQNPTSIPASADDADGTSRYDEDF